MKQLIFVALLGGFIGSELLAAQTDTFTGTDSWDTSGDWNLLASPQGAETAVISTGSAATLTSNSTFTGSTDLIYTFGFSEPAAPQLTVDGNAGALSATSSVYVGQGATFTLGDTATTIADPDRLNHAASIELNYGQFKLISSSFAGITSQQAGNLILDQGYSQITLQQASTSAQTELVMASVTAAPGAILDVTATNLGQTSATANSSRLLFTAAPTVIGGGGAAGSTNISIIPYMVASNTGEEGPSELVTYDPVTGVRPLNSVTEYATDIATANATDNVRITSAASLPSGATINSLTMVYNPLDAYTLDLGVGNTLNVTSGVLFEATPGNSGFSAIRPTIMNGTVNFGSQMGYISALNVASSITGSGGVTIYSGSLSGANSYSGITYVNSETTLGSNTALGAIGAGNGTILNNSTIALNPGVATSEDFTVENDTPDEGFILAGGNQLNGNLTTASPNMTIVELPGTGTGTVNGNITSSGSGLHTVYVQSGVAFNGNITDGDGTVSLAFQQSGTSILAGNNTFSGGTDISLDANLEITSATGLGTSGVSVDNGSTLSFALNSDTTIANSIGGLGSVVKSGSATLILTGSTGWSGGTTISAGILQIGDGGTIGSIGTGSITDSGELAVDLSSNASIAGIISGPGSVANEGTGMLALAGNNTFTGAVNITHGSVEIGAAAAVGAAQPLGEGGTVYFQGDSSSPAALIYEGSGSVATLQQNLSISPGGYAMVERLDDAPLNLNGSIEDSGGQLVFGQGRLVVNGVISGSAPNSNLSIRNGGSGSTIVGLTNLNTYNGSTVVSNGSTLLTGVTNALPVNQPSALTLGGSTDNGLQLNTVDLLGNAETVGFLSATGSAINQIVSSNGSASTPAVGSGASGTIAKLTVADSTPGIDAYSGSLGADPSSRFLGGVGSANNLQLVLQGGGSLALTKATGNTYTGGTMLLGGELYADSTSNSSTGSGSVAAVAGSTLAGTGIIQPTGTAGVTIYGSLAPGGVQPAAVNDGSTNLANGNLKLSTSNFMPGAGTVPNSILTLNGGNLIFALGSGNSTSGSQLMITGGIANTISFIGHSTVTINDLVGANLTNQEYLLIDGNNTTYSGLQLGATSALGTQIIGGLSLQSSTAGNSFSELYDDSQLYLLGDNIEINVVPEPDSLGLFLVGIACVWRCWPRLRQRQPNIENYMLKDKS